MSVTVKIKKIHPDAKLPKYAKEGDACMDVASTRMEITDKFIEYGTGLTLEIPEGYVCLLFPRSSVTNKDMMLKNSIGVLDSGYRGEMIFRFHRFSNEIYEVGERIGQIMVIPRPYMVIEEVDNLSESERGTGGFGHTGK